MTKQTEDPTWTTYNDPDIIAGYIENHAKNRKIPHIVTRFVSTLPANAKILDIGCGPGHDAIAMAQLGFSVTAIDYAPNMIKAAQKLAPKTKLPITFQVANVKDIASLFKPHSFDAVWAAASLLHLSPKDLSDVLKGIHTVVTPGGKIYIGLKAGKPATKLITETKYGKPMQRSFVFWDSKSIEKYTKAAGFTTEALEEHKFPNRDGSTTSWLVLFLST